MGCQGFHESGEGNRKPVFQGLCVCVCVCVCACAFVFEDSERPQPVEKATGGEGTQAAYRKERRDAWPFSSSTLGGEEKHQSSQFGRHGEEASVRIITTITGHRSACILCLCLLLQLGG